MTEGQLATHGISIETMAELIKAGLATARGERVRAGDTGIEVAIMKITTPGAK